MRIPIDDGEDGAVDRGDMATMSVTLRRPADLPAPAGDAPAAPRATSAP